MPFLLKLGGAKQGKARRGRARLGTAMHGVARRGLARPCVAGQGSFESVTVIRDTAEDCLRFGHVSRGDAGRC